MHLTGCKNVEGIKKNLQQLIEYANKNNIPIIYCCDAHESNDPELKRNGGPWEEHVPFFPVLNQI